MDGSKREKMSIAATPSSATSCDWSFDGKEGILLQVLQFTSDEQFLCFAIVMKGWKAAWDAAKKKKKTRAVTTLVTESQLAFAFDSGLNPSRQILCGLAALGNIDLLCYAVGKGCLVDESVCAAAAGAGQMDTVKYLREKECVWVPSIAEAACEGGHLELLRYLHDSGCPLGESIALHALKYKGEDNNEVPPCFDFCLSPEVLGAPDAWNKKKTSRVFALLEAVLRKNFYCLEKLTDVADCECGPLALGWAIQSKDVDDVRYADIVRFVFELVDVEMGFEEKQRFFSDAFIYGNIDVLSILTTGWEGCSQYLHIAIPDNYVGRSISVHRDPMETVRSVRWLLQEGFFFADGDTTFLSKALQIGSMELVRLGISQNQSWHGHARDGFVRAANEGRLEHLLECYTDHAAAVAMFGSEGGLDMAMAAAKGGSIDALRWILERIGDSLADMGQIAKAAASGGSVSALCLVFSPDLDNLAEVAKAGIGHLEVLEFFQSFSGVELHQLLVPSDALMQAVSDGNVDVFNFLYHQFPAESIRYPDLLDVAVQSGVYFVVERILSACPELTVHIRLIETAVSPGLFGAGGRDCFFEIAALLYTRVDREAWVGENDVCSLAEEGGNYAVVRWAVKMGCYRPSSS